MTKKQLVAFLMAAALVVTGGGVSTLASQVAADAKDAPKATGVSIAQTRLGTDDQSTDDQEEIDLVIYGLPTKPMGLGASTTLTAYFVRNGSDLELATEVEWSSSNTDVATIGKETGEVKAVADGKTTITAKASYTTEQETTSSDQTSDDQKEQTTTYTATAVIEVNGASIAATGLSINPDSFTLAVGEKKTLDAEIEPANATDKEVTWSIDDTEIASIDTETGTVEAKKVGEATITATLKVTGGDPLTATSKLTVTDGTTVTGITLDNESLIVAKDKTAKITATLAPAGANAVIEWTSSKPKVASVDNEGNVNGLKGGKATITATVKDTDISATCEVAVAAVTLNATSAPLQVGKSTNAVKIAKQSLESDAVDSWESSDDSIATVGPKGKIKGIAVGTATITVNMKSGATASCEIKVQKGKVKTKGLTLAPKGVITLAVKDNATVTATRNPVTATDKIKWSTSDSKVAKVKNGKITATGVGKAKITATANGKKASINVTVKKPSIKLAKTKATIKVGKSTTIKVAKVFPADDKVTYKSGDKKIATVNKAGKVTGKKAGTTKITVTTESGAKATFTVTVKKKK